ncbi:ATP-binding protein [Paenibacillus caseinilyticus]|uniref:histidine kinase n=1 Tax=Paenibacillus mucilaginosus K02 TaxID=997761 RepID=I0BQQ5_9BACL|nr:sensor histidine kinase [Paenibacillus mucilaginosus]AFH64702.1 sensor histidine kinase [Paenibacillus mucilaginosus K02]AFK65410.1 sensor histidine kinase [Paenibacillus mucilaginosus K02]
MRLQNKLILVICSLLALVTLSLGGTFYYLMNSALEEQIGTRALKVAETVAAVPDIRKAFTLAEPSAVIQPIAESIRLKTGAEYIVIGSREGIRYSHPLPERIGKEMVGGDNGPVLEGRSIVSRAVGSLGPALRGKTPVKNESGDVIGIVSVGFLTKDIDVLTETYRYRIVWLTLGVLLVGAIGAVLIARSVRSSIHGLEPREIGSLYMEKQAILETIREGILAVNREGVVTLANPYALRLLGLPEHSDITGRPLQELLPNTRLTEVISSGQAEFDQEMLIGSHEVIVNRVPITGWNGGIEGAVSSFRSKSELYRLAEELSQVRRFADALRAQTHEYSNKLYLISGLIQLEAYQEAVDLIARESDVHQNLVAFLMREIPDPMIGGLLIGKYNRSRELKVIFEIDRESSFRDLPPGVDRSLLVTVIGNLADNAMEAVLACGDPAGRGVKLFLTDLGEDLIIECEDTGIGIPDEAGDSVFAKGFSTKEGEHRGIGLALVQHAVHKLGGYITYQPHPGGGTVFTAAIPKNGRGTERRALQ